MSKARDLANLLGGGTSGAITFGGTAAIRVPNGTTEQRPTPAAGMIRYNTTTGFAEVYDGNVWAEFGAPPPSISTVTPSTYNGESGTTFTINGANFTADATVFFVTSGGTEVQAGSVAFVSGAQLTATTPQDFTVADEPLDVKVVQASGQITKLDVIDCGGVPAWDTASGTIATIYDRNGSYSPITTVSASDPDSGATITYSIASGSLPAGTSLNSATGEISGDPTDTEVQVTSNFTLSAVDNAGNSSQRAFSIIVNPFLDGSTSARAVVSGTALYDIGAPNGYYWVKPTGQSAYYVYVDNTRNGGGWVLCAKVIANSSFDYVTTNAFNISGSNGPTLTLNSPQKLADSWMTALRGVSTYSGTTAFWAEATTYNKNCFISTAMTINLGEPSYLDNNRTIVGPTYEGTLYDLAQDNNPGSIGFGDHYTDSAKGFSFARHPEQGGNGGGFAHDSEGAKSSGYFWVK